MRLGELFDGATRVRMDAINIGLDIVCPIQTAEHQCPAGVEKGGKQRTDQTALLLDDGAQVAKDLVELVDARLDLADLSFALFNQSILVVELRVGYQVGLELLLLLLLLLEGRPGRGEFDGIRVGIVDPGAPVEIRSYLSLPKKATAEEQKRPTFRKRKGGSLLFAARRNVSAVRRCVGTPAGSSGSPPRSRARPFAAPPFAGAMRLQRR